MTDPQFDALIVGAGPAGSTAAILLARAGWSVALLERAEFPRRKVCGECIAATNLPLLDALGVGGEFAALAGPQLQRVALWCGAQSASARLPAFASGSYPWGRALDRAHLDQLLLERARASGVIVLQPWVAESLGGRPGGFTCVARRLPGRERQVVSASIAIAAHGTGALPSERAQPAGRAQRARNSGALLAFKADYRDVRLEPGTLPVLCFRGGYGGIVIADAGRATLAFCIRADRLEAARRLRPGASAGAAVEAVLRAECAPLRTCLAGATRVTEWLATGPLRTGVHLGRPGGALRIGNAAGEAHPIIGEGISMAIQSAWLLSRELLRSQPRLPQLMSASASADCYRALQRRYAREWRALFAPRLRLAACFARAAMYPVPTAAFARLCRIAPPVLTTCAQWSGKVLRSVHPPEYPA